MSMQHTTLQPDVRSQFRRHECKYVISEEMAGEIRHHIAPYVQPDRHAAGSDDTSYDITSLYLDSDDLKLFWETEEGRLDRIKLRIRSYDDALQSPVFLEIKRRSNSLVLKSRARVDRQALASLLSGVRPKVGDLPADQLHCCEEFAGWMSRWLAQPMVWVRYRREAYEGTYNPDVRITFDRRLVCASAQSRVEVVPPAHWRDVEPRRVVLELKFDGAHPAWMTRLVRRFQLQRRSFSKYGRSVRRGIDRSLLSATDAWSLGA